MAEKGPSKGQKSKFRKTEKKLFSHSPKKHKFKKLGCWVENCGLWVGNRQTNRQKSKDRGSPFRAFGVPHFSPSSKSGPILVFDLVFLW